MKKFPRTPSMKGYVLQFMAILSLLGPKICLASVTVINAPYQFGLLYFMEYLLLLGHNIILYRSFYGNTLSYYSPLIYSCGLSKRLESHFMKQNIDCQDDS